MPKSVLPHLRHGSVLVLTLDSRHRRGTIPRRAAPEFRRHVDHLRHLVDAVAVFLRQKVTPGATIRGSREAAVGARLTLKLKRGGQRGKRTAAGQGGAPGTQPCGRRMPGPLSLAALWLGGAGAEYAQVIGGCQLGDAKSVDAECV